jgi:hypothetical protein
MKPPRHKDAELIRLVRQLGSRSAWERQVAESTLRQMGPDAIDVLLAFVTKENRWRFGRVYLRILAIMVPSMVLWATLVFHTMLSGVWMVLGWLVWTIGFALIGSYIARRGQMSRRQRNAVTALSVFEDLRVIGPLAEALYYPDKKIQAMAATALPRLLPRLRDDHGASLTRQQRLCLYYCLKPAVLTIYPVRDQDLILAVLRALVRIDNRTAISLVHSLATGEGAARTDPEIREAAVACDRFLQQREQYGEQHDFLLRASAPQIASDQLLRPAQDSSETPAQLLLRSTVSGESEER